MEFKIDAILGSLFYTTKEDNLYDGTKQIAN